MDKNKMIIVDGVHYELSPADWKQQQQILSRAKVVKAVAAEKLTDAVVQRLIGHTNVVYYNFETNAWNTVKYNGRAIIGQDADTWIVKDFKAMTEKITKFSRQYEFAASITMTIDRRSFRGWAGMVSNPKYSQNGTAVVGNIIVKNKTTGKYELYCKHWVGIDDYFNQGDAVLYGLSRFAQYGVSPAFSVALIAAHER